MFALLVSYSVTAQRDTDLVKVKKVCTNVNLRPSSLILAIPIKNSNV